MGDPIDSEQLERGEDSKDEGYDSQDEDNEFNYSTSEDEVADEEHRAYELQERLGVSIGNVESDISDDEDEPRLSASMGNEGASVPADREGLYDLH